MCYVQLCLLQTPETPQCWANSQTFHCFPCPGSLRLGCPGSAGLPCVFWACLTPGRSKVAAKSPLYLQSKLWAPASPYKWLWSHGWLSAGFCVPLETPTQHWPCFLASPDTRRKNAEMWFEAVQPHWGEELLFWWGGGDKDTSARPRQSMAVLFYSGIPKAWRAGASAQMPLPEQEAEPRFHESHSV